MERGGQDGFLQMPLGQVSGIGLTNKMCCCQSDKAHDESEKILLMPKNGNHDTAIF